MTRASPPAEPITYKKGYQYQLQADRVFATGLKLNTAHQIAGYIDLKADGEILIRKGYAWDGATMCPDVSAIMRAALVHDALYQLMRDGGLHEPAFRLPADVLLRRMCVTDGLPTALAWVVYLAVRVAGKRAATSGNKKKVHHAPSL